MLISRLLSDRGNANLANPEAPSSVVLGHRHANLARFFIATCERRTHLSANLVSDSVAEKGCMECDHLAVFAGDCRYPYFHIVRRHPDSRVSSASPVAGGGCGAGTHSSSQRRKTRVNLPARRRGYQRSYVFSAVYPEDRGRLR